MLMRTLAWGVLWLLFMNKLYGQAYNLVGDAVAYGEDCYRLTDDVPWQNGAVWYADKLSIASSFELEFTMNFGNHNSNGADGIVLVLQTQGNRALGNPGQGIGFKGFAPSLGIEFDTHRNTDEQDPTYDHLALVQDGIINHQSPQNLAGPVPASALSDNIEDGRDHLVRVRWDVTSQVLDVYFDCALRLSSRVDMASIFGGQQEVWWGFTGGTGQLSNTQRVCLRKDIVVRDTFEICPGEAVQLVARSSPSNQYSWSPAGLVNSSTIQNPLARPTQDQLFVVTYQDYCGRLVQDSVFVQVAQPFSLDLGEKRVFCGENSWELVPEVSAADPALKLHYRWSTGDTLPTILPQTAGWYQLTLRADACYITDSVEVVLYPADHESTLPSTFHCFYEDALQLSSALAEERQDYYWPHSEETAAAVYVSRGGEYELISTNRYGCRFRETFVVDEQCPAPPVAPEAFTPNGDGHNDLFRIISRRAIDLRWMVYDRWGNVIFVGNGQEAGWDGYYQGVLCPPGAYPWKANYRPLGKTQDAFSEKRGVVWLIR
ncbi:hypothetical protein GCM10027275_39850 [Rhabdobacter roseus]|uniref:Gliding motility-associated-like protein n=1 Tax=Rhabdobacter roseus TaxID=1655419 RepID=A0A840TVT1_9BACT|nr:T9SS type B sorting domain-containing protein [Rhabdobacter roseus]MBB5285692.1 gliding motility-associated-like protein [Rhabdobacter roseus]